VVYFKLATDNLHTSDNYCVIQYFNCNAKSYVSVPGIAKWLSGTEPHTVILAMFSSSLSSLHYLHEPLCHHITCIK